MLERLKGKEGSRGWDDSITDAMHMNLSHLWETMENRRAWCAAVHGFAKSWTWLRDWTIRTKNEDWLPYIGNEVPHIIDRDNSFSSAHLRRKSRHVEGGCCKFQSSAQWPMQTNLWVRHLQIHIAPVSWASQLTPQLEIKICPGKYSNWVNWVSFQKPLSSRRRPWRCYGQHSIKPKDRSSER